MLLPIQKRSPYKLFGLKNTNCGQGGTNGFCMYNVHTSLEQDRLQFIVEDCDSFQQALISSNIFVFIYGNIGCQRFATTIPSESSKPPAYKISQQ